MRCLQLFVAAFLMAAPAVIAAQVQMEYDFLGRLTRVAFQNGSSIQYSYDAVGNRLQVVQTDGLSGVGDGTAAVIDFNGDSVADAEDLALLRGAFGSREGDPCFGGGFDLTGDGGVDEVDVLAWFARCPDLAWHPGDWTGRIGGVAGGETGSLSAPDGRVDFADLAVLARSWRADETMAGWRAFLDLSAGPGAARLDGNDLGVFRSHWLQGEPVGAVCPAGDGAPAQITVEPPLCGTISARLSPTPPPSPETAYVDVVLTPAVMEAGAFQFLLAGDVNLARTADGPEGLATEALVLPGAAAPGDEGTAFVDLRVEGDGWLATGAFLDGAAAPADDGALLLCRLLVRARAGSASVEIADGRLALRSGEILTAAGWSGEVGLLPDPTQLILRRIYPNPFNPRTEVEFGVARAERVEIRIYDLQGRLVCTLADETLQPGWHRREWDGRDSRGREVGSGLYLLRLRSREGGFSRKLMLVR